MLLLHFAALRDETPADLLAHIEPCLVDRNLAGLRLRENQRVRRHPRKPAGLLRDDFQILHPLFRLDPAAGLIQIIGEAFDGGEGCFELMCEIIRKLHHLVLRPLQLFHHMIEVRIDRCILAGVRLVQPHRKISAGHLPERVCQEIHPALYFPQNKPQRNKHQHRHRHNHKNHAERIGPVHRQEQYGHRTVRHNRSYNDNQREHPCPRCISNR